MYLWENSNTNVTENRDQTCSSEQTVMSGLNPKMDYAVQHLMYLFVNMINDDNIHIKVCMIDITGRWITSTNGEHAIQICAYVHTHMRINVI